MTGTVFGPLLFAALLNATWNGIVKGAEDKVLTTVMVTASAAALAALALPFLPQPARASWPFIAASALCQVAYLALLARVYAVADMSRAYPLMRGAAPLLVALAGALRLGGNLSSLAWLGVAMMCSGIFAMALDGRRGGGRGTRLALLNSAVIAGYTLVDGLGVRRSGAPLAYTLWGLLLTGVPLAGWAMVARRAAFCRSVARHGHLGLLGGIATTASYGTALWAMTVAPIAVVAALRETSILFGVALSGLVLRERVTPARLAAAVLIALGAATLRLA